MDIETHPWPPFIPDGTKALFMGTFPPGAHRHAMDFFYPNRTNDFWRVMGLIFFDNVEALYDREQRTYRLAEIKQLLTVHHIAMGDTGYRIRRLRGNASDKFLEIVEPVDLDALLRKMPALKAIATSGEKAASVLASLTGTEVPALGSFIEWTPPAETEYPQKAIRIWRLPSTSRAYPLAVDKKAVPYRAFLADSGCL